MGHVFHKWKYLEAIIPRYVLFAVILTQPNAIEQLRLITVPRAAQVVWVQWTGNIGNNNIQFFRNIFFHFKIWQSALDLL